MSSFGATAIYWGEMAFGATPVYYGEMAFGAQAVYLGEMAFGAQACYLGSMAFGAKAIYMGSCFPKSELVHTSPDTYVPIGMLKVGDKISSWDIERGKMQYTAITKIHKSNVTDIVCFNNSMRVSINHPLMVLESGGNGIFIPKWKVAFDVNIGDCIAGSNGKHIIINSKNNHKHSFGMEVLNLSTDGGTPFFAGDFVVRADNAQDQIGWANTSHTQVLLSA